MQTAVKKKPIQRAAILHDLCTVGKAAMTNILPVLSVLGVEACPVPTMVLSTAHGRLRKTCHLSAVRLCRGLRKASEKSGFFL